jgi:drug/metabolite transporter (DMT)-like permease
LSQGKKGVLYAVIAVILFSCSPVFIRWAAPLSPYEITAWRMVIGSVFIAGFALMKGEIPRLHSGDTLKFIVFGLITALHFLAYIASLNYTSIAHSLTITYSSPIFVTLFSALFLKERIPQRKYLGVIAVIAGIGVLAGFEPKLTPSMLLGDALALVSAIMFGFYSIAGRSQRHIYPLLSYAAIVYGFAALWLLPFIPGQFSVSAYGWRQIISLLVLGILPLGVGHTLYNAAIRRIHPTYANLLATQEVTGGVLLGALLLGETPGLNSLIGIIITLCGLFLVII